MKFIIRLDDASEKMDIDKWDRIEKILDKYDIKPLVGIIPDCKDHDMEKYPICNEFWDAIIERWKNKKWVFALHGCHHTQETQIGGINPINKKSEYAGLSLDRQKFLIQRGLEILNAHGIKPRVFFAPFHTFDLNTLIALKESCDIRIVSDTIANKPYKNNGILFVPQQCGSCRKIPLKVVTFCYHPNMMKEADFEKLDKFLQKNRKLNIPFPLDINYSKKSVYDKLLSFLYFYLRKIRSKR